MSSIVWLAEALRADVVAELHRRSEALGLRQCSGAEAHRNIALANGFAAYLGDHACKEPEPADFACPENGHVELWATQDDILTDDPEGVYFCWYLFVAGTDEYGKEWSVPYGTAIEFCPFCGAALPDQGVYPPDDEDELAGEANAEERKQ